jgi:AraC-like DNA-binding protein
MLQVRVERARSALARGRSIAETALECGFADQSHLTRRFKRVLGFSPGECARAAAHASMG